MIWDIMSTFLSVFYQRWQQKRKTPKQLMGVKDGDQSQHLSSIISLIDRDSCSVLGDALILLFIPLIINLINLRNPINSCIILYI